MIGPSIILFITALIVLLSIFFTNRTGTVTNGNTLLGLALPVEKLRDEAVVKIISKYRRANNCLTLALFVLAFPFFLISFVSIVLIYMVIWGTAVYWLYGFMLKKYHDELLSLKEERQWWVGTSRAISIDTEVSRLKHTLPIARIWFLLPTLIALIPILMLLLSKTQNLVIWVTALSGITAVFAFYSLSRVYANAKTRVYSEDTEINMVLNRLYKREWSKCWLIIALLNSGLTATLCWILHDIKLLYLAFAIYACLSGSCTVASFIYTYSKIRKERKRLLQISTEEVYTDDDLYWDRWSYNNPNDNRWWVEKRMGIGMTINEGKKGAKLIAPVSFALVIALFLGPAIYVMPIEFGSVSLFVSDDVITISAPLSDDFCFQVKDVVSVSLVDDFPNSTKIKGSDSSRLFAGRFLVSGYEVCHVYLHLNNPPYIAVATGDGWVFVNGKSQDETERYYIELSTLLY